MSLAPVRVLANAILVWSGDHTGHESMDRSFVSRTTPAPSARIAKICRPPSRSLTKSMESPDAAAPPNVRGGGDRPDSAARPRPPPRGPPPATAGGRPDRTPAPGGG